MSLESYYKDHWVEIEPERMDRYESMFQWSPSSDPLLAAAEIAPGQTVADFGCGPGILAVELARRVGPKGHVHALDINADFVDRTRARAAAEGFANQIEAHHLTGGDLPLNDCALDRLVAKNVLVYVDDPLATFDEFYRVLKPGGKAHAIEGDWGITIMEPVPADDWKAFLDAASHAFRNPQIGREMYGLAKRAGFSSVAVQVKSVPDTEGRFLNMVNNLAGYARRSGSLSEDQIQAVLDTAAQAAKEGKFLGLAPQFLVTAIV